MVDFLNPLTAALVGANAPQASDEQRVRALLEEVGIAPQLPEPELAREPGGLQRVTAILGDALTAFAAAGPGGQNVRPTNFVEQQRELVNSNRNLRNRRDAQQAMLDSQAQQQGARAALDVELGNQRAAEQSALRRDLAQQDAALSTALNQARIESSEGIAQLRSATDVEIARMRERNREAPGDRAEVERNQLIQRAGRADILTLQAAVKAGEIQPAEALQQLRDRLFVFGVDETDPVAAGLVQDFLNRIEPIIKAQEEEAAQQQAAEQQARAEARQRGQDFVESTRGSSGGIVGDLTSFVPSARREPSQGSGNRLRDKRR